MAERCSDNRPDLEKGGNPYEGERRYYTVHREPHGKRSWHVLYLSPGNPVSAAISAGWREVAPPQLAGHGGKAVVSSRHPILHGTVSWIYLLIDCCRQPIDRSHAGAGWHARIGMLGRGRGRAGSLGPLGRLAWLQMTGRGRHCASHRVSRQEISKIEI